MTIVRGHTRKTGKGKTKVTPHTRKTHKYTVKQYSEKKVDELFSEMADHYKLISGDIAPDQSLMVDDFVYLLTTWVKQNQRYKRD